ncbi:MAG: hypothetical protein IID46_08190 [Planctomycetes bacterium]|nr:hypothetical protein [Planctomycetota bacterium]
MYCQDGKQSPAEKNNRVFRAGAATSNITPPLGELIVGGWKPIPARAIHDELHARCLMLDDGRTRLAIVLCDNVGIPQEVFDAAKTMIRSETGMEPHQVLTASTHTHSATTARGPNKMTRESKLNAYQKFLARRIADVVRLAGNNLEPAQIGWGRTSEPSQVFNRRWYVTDPKLLRNPFGGVDTVRMNPPRGNSTLVRPAGPTDPEISFLSVKSTEGRPIALLANYSLHYVGGVRSGDVSADYFGIFAERIAKRLHAERLQPRFVGILSNGTSGDVNNINFRERSPRLPPYEKMTQVADLVAEKVYQAHKQIKFQDWVPLSSSIKELKLRVRKPTQEQLDYFKKVLAKGDGEAAWHSRERIYADRLQRLSQAPDEVTISLQAVRIGDLGIAAVPFEVFTEIGLEIKEKSPLKQTFTIELANGSFGYLPTPEQHKLGGYETWLGTNNVEKEASTKIVRTLLDLFAELADQQPKPEP